VKKKNVGNRTWLTLTGTYTSILGQGERKSKRGQSRCYSGGGGLGLNEDTSWDPLSRGCWESTEKMEDKRRRKERGKER